MNLEYTAELHVLGVFVQILTYYVKTSNVIIMVPPKNYNTSGFSEYNFQ